MKAKDSSINQETLEAKMLSVMKVVLIGMVASAFACSNQDEVIQRTDVSEQGAEQVAASSGTDYAQYDDERVLMPAKEDLPANFEQLSAEEQANAIEALAQNRKPREVEGLFAKHGFWSNAWGYGAWGGNCFYVVIYNKATYSRCD